MKLWPVKKFVVASIKSLDEFSNDLLLHTEKNASGYYWFRREGASFTGSIDRNGFSVYKTVPYWNLSPVKINGEFIMENKPLVIKIKMYNSFTLPVFILFFIVTAGLLYNYTENPPWGLISSLFITFYLMINIPFQIEADKAKKIILEISEGQIVEKDI